MQKYQVDFIYRGEARMDIFPKLLKCCLTNAQLMNVGMLIGDLFYSHLQKYLNRELTFYFLWPHGLYS